MGLIDRLRTLARADAHGVVDALEDKALMLRQHLRDARAELERKRCAVEALGAEDKDLEAEAARVRNRSEAFDRDVALALRDGKEVLARYAVRQLLPLRQGTEQIRERRAAIVQERAALEDELARQEVEFRHLEQRVKAHLARLERDPSSLALFTDHVVTDEDVELELLRRRGPSEAPPVELEGGAP